MWVRGTPRIHLRGFVTMSDTLISRQKLAARWGCSVRTVDRLRVNGLIPWLDLVAGRGNKPLVRFRLQDVLDYEERFRQCADECAGNTGGANAIRHS
jgi:hypothetical protein